MRFDVSIIIIGKICSGKSTLAKDFAQWLNYPIGSFGKYLLKYSKQNGLKTDRDSLQDLGEGMIQKEPAKFLNNVIELSDPEARIMIFEGVRHQVILDGIKNVSKETLTIFLDVKTEIRQQRFINREKEIDSGLKAIEDFNRFSSHSVEQEVDSLQSQADFVIASNKSYRDFLKILSIY